MMEDGRGMRKELRVKMDERRGMIVLLTIKEEDSAAESLSTVGGRDRKY